MASASGAPPAAPTAALQADATHSDDDSLPVVGIKLRVNARHMRVHRIGCDTKHRLVRESFLAPEPSARRRSRRFDDWLLRHSNTLNVPRRTPRMCADCG